MREIAGFEGRASGAAGGGMTIPELRGALLHEANQQVTALWSLLLLVIICV
jgi:hypothetical protein